MSNTTAVHQVYFFFGATSVINFFWLHNQRHTQGSSHVDIVVLDTKQQAVSIQVHAVSRVCNGLSNLPRSIDLPKPQEAGVLLNGLVRKIPASPELRTLPTNRADCASPSASTIFCCRSCFAFSTMRAARWAFCCATCLASTAAYDVRALNSLPHRVLGAKCQIRNRHVIQHQPKLLRTLAEGLSTNINLTFGVSYRICRLTFSR